MKFKIKWLHPSIWKYEYGLGLFAPTKITYYYGQRPISGFVTLQLLGFGIDVYFSKTERSNK